MSAAQKKVFILSTTKIFIPARRRIGKSSNNSRRKVTYKYFFNVRGLETQVCKNYYCRTLAISQKPIYTAHANKDVIAGTPLTSSQGKHIKKTIAQEDKDMIKEHINSFPCVEAHYCRASSSKKYLESGLTISKMYSLYLETMKNLDKQPVKESAYRNIFCNEFNISFHKPKKDRCNICERYKLLKEENRLDQEENKQYEEHIAEKVAMRDNRQKDRDNKNKAVITFDLENVLTCPKAEISQFYYKTKFSVYNLTAHLSTTKQVYCAIWTEATMGRKGNDIASALHKIIQRVLNDNPDIKELTLWSDSCVPQNRNSVMSFSIGRIMKQNPNLQKITMKYSTPGHSAVQEIDAVHSCIERVLNRTEYYSPVSLMRLLVKVNRKKPYKIMQMISSDFLNYQEQSRNLNYQLVPFSKVKMLQFNTSYYEIKYKISYQEENFETVQLKKSLRKPGNTGNIFDAKISPSAYKWPDSKVASLTSMMPWMPAVDRDYFTAILPKKV